VVGFLDWCLAAAAELTWQAESQKVGSVAIVVVQQTKNTGLVVGPSNAQNEYQLASLANSYSQNPMQMHPQ